MVNGSAGEAFTNSYRGMMNAGNMYAGTIGKLARTAQLPKQMQLRELQVRSTLEMRKRQLAMQAQSQRLALMRMQLQMQAMNMRMQDANNRIASAYGQAPMPYTMGGAVLTAPSAGNGGERNAQDISSTDVGALENSVLNPAMVDQIPGDNLADTLPRPQRNRVNAAQGGPVFTVADQLQMIKSGRAYNMPLAGSDDIGKFSQANPTTKAALEQVIVAMPQLSHSMDLIEQGIEYYGNSPAELKSYFSALSSYLTGNPTEKDKQVIQKAGISNIAMIGATEQIMRVMNLAKTNETLEKTLEMIMPAKGDTKDTYLTKQKALFDELKSRAAQAQYAISMGIPQDVLGQIDMKKYADAIMQNNIYGSIYEKDTKGAPIPRLHSPVPNQISFGEIESGPITLPNQAMAENNLPDTGLLSAPNEEESINKIMESYPDLTREQAIAVYKKYQEGAS